MKNIKEILNYNLGKVVEQIETIENTEKQVELRISLISVLANMNNKEINLDEFKGTDSLDSTKKKKSKNSKANKVQEALDQLDNKTNAETTQEDLEETANEIQDAMDATPDEVIHSLEENAEHVDQVEEPQQEEVEAEEEQMLMESGDGSVVDIKPAYDLLVNITSEELEDYKQYIAFYATEYDLTEIVSAFTSELESDISVAINDANAQAFYEYILACME